MIIALIVVSISVIIVAAAVYHLFIKDLLRFGNEITWGKDENGVWKWCDCGDCEICNQMKDDNN